MGSENVPVKVTLTRGYKKKNFSANHIFTVLKVSFQLYSALSIIDSSSLSIIIRAFSNRSLESGREKLNFFSFFTVKLTKEGNHGSERNALEA